MLAGMVRTLGVGALLLAACGSDGSKPEASDDPDAHVEDLDASVPDARIADAHVTEVDAAAVRDSADTPTAQQSQVRLPPANGGLDYQLGGAYAPPAGVTIVSRDRKASPAPGLYNVCYVNGFQAQAEEESFWLTEQPDLVLRDNAGKPVIDRDWDEMLLDVSTPEKRTRLAAIVGGWIDGCAEAGFDAVEIDNLDSYSRSGGRLEEDNAVAFLALLSEASHRRGLAIAQKNSSELAARKRELGTDFAVAEECARYDECNVYMSAYAENVLMIEYRRNDFERACSDHPDYPIVLRDVNLVSPGDKAYVFEDC